LLEVAHYNRIITLVYTPDFPADSRREVSVSYRTAGTMDKTKTAKPLYTFDYFFNPAENWSSFRNLSVRIITPAKAPYVVASSVDLIQESERVYTSFLENLPGNDLTFTLYEAPEIAALDKAQGYVRNKFGYLAYLIMPAVALLIVAGILKTVITIIMTKRNKKKE
jgi:hypothetical protein